jgi:hypothetical protein
MFPPPDCCRDKQKALASENRKTPVDLIGGKRQGHIDPKIRATVLEAEIGFLTSARPETIKAMTTRLKNTTQMAIRNFMLVLIDEGHSADVRH